MNWSAQISHVQAARQRKEEAKRASAMEQYLAGLRGLYVGDEATVHEVEQFLGASALLGFDDEKRQADLDALRKRDELRAEIEDMADPTREERHAKAIAASVEAGHRCGVDRPAWDAACKVVQEINTECATLTAKQRNLEALERDHAELFREVDALSPTPELELVA